MDPFTLLIQRTESERKFEDILLALRELQVANPDRREHFDGIIGRLQENTEPDIPAAQQEINNFTFEIPQFSINDIAARPNYRPMTYNTHWKEENGRVFYNEALLTAAYEDETVVATRAREVAANQPNAPNAEELERIYQRALNQQATINATACRVPPVWTLIQRKDLNDTRAEDSWIQYADDKHKHVNWYDTIKTIRTMGEYLGYTELHYRRLLDRFVSYFASGIAPVARRMPLASLCRMLMTSSMPAPDKEITLDAIRKLTRLPGECLRIPMTNLYTLANAYYETDGTRNYEGQVNQLLFIGLQHFTMGQTKAQLLKIIKHSQTSKQKIDYQKTLNTCIESEKLYGTPTETLQYGQNLDVITVFTSVYDPIESLIDTDIIPVQPSLDPTHRRTDKKYGSDKKERSGPTIHSVKTKILGPRPVHGHYQSSTQSSSGQSSTQPSSGPSSAPSAESSRTSTPEPGSSSHTSRETTPEGSPKTPREKRYERREQRRQSIESQSSQSSRDSRNRRSRSPAKTNQDAKKMTAPTGTKQKPKKEKKEPSRRSERNVHHYNTDAKSSSEHATPTNSRNNSRGRSQDRNKSSSNNYRKDRESSAEAKRLAQEGARKAQPSSDTRYQSNDRRNNYENRSRSPGYYRQERGRSSDRRQQDNRRERTPTNSSYRPYSPRQDGYQSSRDRYQSPRRDDRYQSPRRDSRYQSPRRDPRYQSPRRDNYRSSDRDNRSSQYRTNSADNRSRQSNYYAIRDNQSSQYRPPSADRRQQYQSNSNRQQSPYRSKSPYQQQSYGYRPASPYRQSSNSQGYSRDSRQRSPYRSDSRQRSRSPGTRPIHGLNCSPNYKDGEKFCRKCMTDGHPEPQCQKYYIWTPSKCSVCRGGYHMSKDCLDQTPKNY